ncbi:hypothetical protein Tco_0356227, partial [Tanacetum coccineum]
WQTATVRTIDNGEQEINATVDVKEFTITEASVRRHLQLADADAEEGEGSGNPSEPQPPPSTAQPTHEEPIPNIESSSPQKTQSPRQALNKDTELPQTSVYIPNIPDEAIHQERGDSVERVATTTTSLEALRDHGGASVQTRFESASKLSYHSPLGGGNTPRSNEDSMTLQELTALCTKLSDRVLALETYLRQTKKVYDDDMASEDSSKQGRMIEEIDQDAGVTLVTPIKVTSQEDQSKDQLGILSAAKVLADAARVHTYSRRRRAVSTGSGGISTSSKIVSIAGMIQQVNIIIPLSSATKDKGKAIMTESEPEQTTTKDAEVAQRLQEEINAAEKQRMAQVHQAAQEEKDKYSEVDQARMLVDLINQRKIYFSTQKAKAKRNKPMTQAQQRTYMSNYIKHMGSQTMQQLKRYTFDEFKELFETTMKYVSTFTSIETEDKERESELAARSSKRPRAEHDEEHDKERDEIAMEFESLATKYPIIDWKIHILIENMIYYQIIRADGSSKNYKIFSKMLDDFDRQNMVDLHKLVQEKYEITSPEGYDLFLWGDLKTLFEPCEEDEVWRNQQGYNLISWRLFDSCGVHVLLMNNGIAIHMMIEEKYPLT